jgi:hypothetical protein
MPLIPPVIDDRRYAELVRDTLARVPVHTPEWTHLGESDPGVTLVELFAFLAESILYRANRVPEAARLKFLRLLGVPLAAAVPAQGLVVFSGLKPDAVPPTLPAGTELRAGELPWRTAAALDVLPLESRVFAKVKVDPAPEDRAYWELLYEAAADPGSALTLYETRELDGRNGLAASDTVDGALWLALLAPPGTRAEQLPALVDAVGRRTLSVGLVPWVDEAPRTLPPVAQGAAPADAAARLAFALPQVRAAVPGQPAQPSWRQLAARTADDPLTGPAVIELPLPPAAEIDTWRDLDPLEAGVGEFPPALDDAALAARLLSWVRITPSSGAQARFLWAGVNVARVTQRAVVRHELLGVGDGSPDQVFRLARGGVVPGSVAVDVLPAADAGAQAGGGGGATGAAADGGAAAAAAPQRWQPIDDLMAAGPEVQAARRSRAPGQVWVDERPSRVFVVDAEAGVLRFGDGLRGARPPAGARVLAHYEVTSGAAGNLPVGAVQGGPALPPGVKAANPLPTWGGADAEDVAEGEKRIAGFVRHRDRLVTAGDFADIARAAPGLQVARVEVLSAWHPDLGDGQSGDAPGVVTLMLVPRHDSRDPTAPLPDRAFLDALCAHLDPRRLVTTELVLRGPSYVGLWISVGIAVAGGFALPDVRDRVRQRLVQVLAPARGLAGEPPEAAAALPGLEQGWPLQRAVNRLDLMAEVARVPGVLRVNELLLAAGSGGNVPTEVAMRALQLPRIAALAVESGAALPLDALRGQTAAPPSGATPTRVVPVPTVPTRC